MNERLLRGMGLLTVAKTLVAIPVVATRPVISGTRPRNGHDGSHRRRD